MRVTSSDVTMSAENNVPAHFEPRVLSAGLVMIKGEVALTSPSKLTYFPTVHLLTSAAVRLMMLMVVESVL